MQPTVAMVPPTPTSPGLIGIDAGGIDVLQAVALKAYQMGVVLTLLVPATGVLESLRAGGFETPQILLEVLDT